jgi:hypothetical protein
MHAAPKLDKIRPFVMLRLLIIVVMVYLLFAVTPFQSSVRKGDAGRLAAL